MTHWSEDAQAKDGAGVRDQDAGDPVLPCVENARVIQVLDSDEGTVIDPEVQITPLPPPIEHELRLEPEAPPIEGELQIPEKEG